MTWRTCSWPIVIYLKPQRRITWVLLRVPFRWLLHQQRLCWSWNIFWQSWWRHSKIFPLLWWIVRHHLSKWLWPIWSLIKLKCTWGHSSNRLYLSAPICFSWKLPQVPKTSEVTLFTVVWSWAPVALATLFISSSGTLPAQKIPLSANHWVAKSPIGSFDKTISAPVSLIFCSFS